MFSMLLYHGQVGSKGAFLALSQFFTLSGFLVMSILLRRADDPDGLRIRGFWGRRYRRLIPASLLTLAGVLLFAFTIATEQQIDGLRSSIPAALLQVVNWHFVVTDASYVDLFQTPSPIQHFWSLAIEEQFYLLTPVLLYGVLRISRSPAVLAGVFLTATTASSVWMWFLFNDGASIDRMYYGTDTRAGEMLVGCLLAIALHYRPPTFGPRARQVLGTAGLAAYAASTWAFFNIELTDGRMYRGGFLIFAVLTAVVILSLVQDAGPVPRVLELQPIAALGRITYGVYLFHWPIMLWLTPERTGLGKWALFALQVGLTIALAWISARWVEAPIRNGRAERGDLRLPIALIAIGALIAVGGFALGTIDRETELAGLGENAGAAPTTIPTEPARVLVVSDGTTTDWIDTELRPRLTGDMAFAGLIDAVPIDWVSRATVARADVVLVEINRYSDLADSGDADDVVAALRELGETGVEIAWRRFVGADQPPALADHPVFEGLTRAVLELPDFHVLQTNSSSDAVVEDLTRLTAATNGDATRVLIVGDSVSRTIGHGLERWGTDSGRVLVWSAGTEGCGLINDGWITDGLGRETEPPDECDMVTESWMSQVDTFDPEIVIVSSNAVDFRERRIDGWEARLEPGDAMFDAYLVARYIEIVDLLSSGGARVRWIPPPCGLDAFGAFTEPDGGSALDPSRLAHVRDEILPAVADARPALEFFDLNAVLCPDDEIVVEIDGSGVLRPDGIHFGVDGSRWLAETHGEELVFGALQ